MILPSGTRPGSFEIVAPIGAGGMGRHAGVAKHPRSADSAGDALDRWALGPIERSGRFRSFRAPQNLWVESLDGKSRRQLTHFTDDREIADAGWSRDGKRFAIARATTTTDIVLIKGWKK